MERLIFKAKDSMAVACARHILDIDPTEQETDLINDHTTRYYQSLFDAWYKANIEDAPKVTGEKWKSFGPWHREQHPEDTHTAKLVDIKEIK